MENKFTKQIVLDFETKESTEKVKKSLDEIKKNASDMVANFSKEISQYVNQKLETQGYEEDFSDLMKDFSENMQKNIKEVFDEVEEVTEKKTKGFKSYIKEDIDDLIDMTYEDLTGGLKKISSKIKDDIQDSITNLFKVSFSGITSAFKNLLNRLISEMKGMLETSQLSNAETRELAFNYGFSASEAYGWKKALGAVGLESEEDLYYANEQELSQFREAFQKYSEKYDKLYDSGFFETMQEFQYEMEDFKNEVMLEIVQFVMNNKELIKDGLRAIMEIAKITLRILKGLNDIFFHQEETATSADIISQYMTTTTNNNKNTNVNVSNQFTNVAKEDETWLANAGELTYEQIIRALGGEA